jgi:tellurium resistance protein TerD
MRKLLQTFTVTENFGKHGQTINNKTKLVRKLKGYMGKLSLNLAKEGENTQNTKSRLSLNLNKGERFKVYLAWDTDHDVDAHAILCTNDGTNGAKTDALEKVLSAYNIKRTIAGQVTGVLQKNSDGSFSTPCGSLTHSGDARTGLGKDVDEIITIDGGKIPVGVNEIPIIITLHPASAPARFSQVKDASIVIKDDNGRELCAFQLTKEFGSFNVVQLGSLLLGDKGWEFAAVGSGFVGDFQKVLDFYS